MEAIKSEVRQGLLENEKQTAEKKSANPTGGASCAGGKMHKREDEMKVDLLEGLRILGSEEEEEEEGDNEDECQMYEVQQRK